MISPEHAMPASDDVTRAGYVALVGQPNVGKSTLLNAFLGTKLSIVTHKAQTTWHRVTGISTSEDAQMIFLDTPGLLEAKDLLQRSMLDAAHEALAEADVILLILDATRRFDTEELGRLQKVVVGFTAPLVTAINKVDASEMEAVERLTQWARDALAGDRYSISALTGDGVEELRAVLDGLLPPGPFLYPPDDIARDPVRFFVAELVRETVFERFHQEIPYSVFCRVEEYREAQDPVYIQVNVFVEQASQKRILIGKKGRAIQELGRKAREKIEDFIGQSVYLDLWIKVLPGWRKKHAELRRLGFRVGENREDAL